MPRTVYEKRNPAHPGQPNYVPARWAYIGETVSQNLSLPDNTPSIRGLNTGTVLDESAWFVSAQAALPDRLIDLSGNGRDAVFGAGAAAPVVLPHDGTDYIYFPDQAVYGVYQYFSKGLTLPAGEVKIDAKFRLPSTGTNLVLMYGQSISAGVIRCRVTTTGNVSAYYFTGNSNEESGVVWNGLGPFDDGAWHDITITFSSDGAGVSLVLDGTDHGYKAFAAPRPLGAAASSYTNGYNGEIAWLSVSQNGVVLMEMDPKNVSADYTTIANTGSVGGNWTITRAASGFKAAVVDRPLVLFSDTQSTRAVVTAPGLNAVSVAIAYRAYGSKTVTEDALYVAGKHQLYEPLGATRNTINWKIMKSNAAWSEISSTGWAANGLRTPARATQGDTHRYLKGDGTFGETTVAETFDTQWTADLHINWDSASEFVAAAVFDRFLTDDEMFRVTQELIGNPLVTTDMIADAAVTDAKIGGSLAPIISDPATGRLSIGGHEIGDTGWRNVTALADPDMTGTGPVKLRRIGDRVIFAMREMTWATSGNKFVLDPPTGFRPTNNTYGALGVLTTGYSYGYCILSNQATWSRLEILGVQPSWVVGGEVSYITNDAWPTTLPGTV